MSAPVTLPELVPVFPLPNVVLFPKALLPLRIFEPRYRAMLKDVLDSHGFIAMALFKPGWEHEYFENPEVFPTVGVGRVLDYQAGEESGTFRIVLLGERRAAIQGWVEGRPYRRARVHPIFEVEPGPEEKEELRARLRSHLAQLTRRGQDIDDEARARIDEVVASADELGYLVDLIAFQFLADPSEKQALLESIDAVQRERLLRDFLRRHSLLDRDPPPGQPRDPPGTAGDAGPHSTRE